MRWSDIQFRPSDKTLRQFAGIWIVFFGGIAAYQGYFHQRTNVAIALGTLAAVVGLPGLAAPRIIRPIYVSWMVAAFPIGWVVSHVILAMIFYGLFTPLGAIFRMMGRDALHRQRGRELESYFVPKITPADPASYLRQY
jgi:hypothetical protein